MLETDFDEYSIMYSCNHFLGIYTVDLLWIMMRKPYPTGSPERDAIETKAKQIVSATLGERYISKEYLRPTVQG